MRQNKDKVKKVKNTAKMAINELRKSKHIQTNDIQTVNTTTILTWMMQIQMLNL